METPLVSAEPRVSAGTHFALHIAEQCMSCFTILTENLRRNYRMYLVNSRKTGSGLKNRNPEGISLAEQVTALLNSYGFYIQQ